MPSIVKSYRGNRHSQKPVFSSVTYRRPYDAPADMTADTDESFIWSGQRYENYDDLTATIARVVMGEPSTLPDDELIAPDADFMPSID